MQFRSKLFIIIPPMALMCLLITAYCGYQKLECNQVNLNSEFWLAMILIILLTPINVLLEAAKLNVAGTSANGIKDSIIKTCQGFSMQFLLPAGLGTAVGRVWNVDDQNKRVQVEATFLGGMMQSLCNLFGLILLLMIQGPFEFKFAELAGGLNGFWQLSLFVILGITISALYFFRNWFKWEIWKSLKPLQFMTAGKAMWNPDQIIRIFAYSFLRYLVYLMQWLLVLVLIGQLSVSDALTAAIAYLALISFVIAPPAFSLLTRSGVALAVFGVMGIEPAISLSLCWLIFLLNNGLPAMMGSIFMFKEVRWATKQ